MCVIIGLLIGYYVAWVSYRPGRTTSDYSERVLVALRQASNQGNWVVNARSILDNNGNFKQGSEAGSWESIVPVFGEKKCPQLSSANKTIIVFVHGYNTTFAEGIENGNSLMSKIRSANSRAPRKVPPIDAANFCFCTFCWRGDFGAEAFGNSESAAERTAQSLTSVVKSLVDQLESLHHTRDQYSMILVTHSLGARVALEALWQMNGDKPEPLVDCLLLVQPAVPIELIAKGRYEKSWDHDVGAPGPITHVVKGETNPKYRSSFAVVANAAATVSSGDGVLHDIFEAYQNPGMNIRWSPPIKRAFGTMTPDLQLANDNNELKYPENCRRLDLSPGKGKVAITDHSQVFADQDLVDHLWQEVLLSHVK
jgi:pimeloyl-ACP methyl ester carboxylesterase